MRHIGILGHSFEGATLCFRTACLEGVKGLGPHMHPEITMTCRPMAPLLGAWDAGDLAALRAFFEGEAHKLSAAGCDFFVCPDNTAHIALETPGNAFPIPALHIAEVVAEQARRDGRSKVGILGTRFTMTGPVYPAALGRRGIACAVPGEADRRIVDDIIFGELCLGVFRDESRRAYGEIIARLKDDGCDAVALVCTEIPLLVGEGDSPLPILDSTRLLARAAVAVATAATDLPGWRGGPVPG